MKFLSIVFLLLLVPIAFSSEMFVQPDQMIQGIMEKQEISSINQIDCNAVTENDYEMLGDSVMEKMIGNSELHEQIDYAMGGGGSRSLHELHATMGANWLSCDRQSAGMMGPMMMRMMGNYYPAYYNGFDSVIILTLIGWILFVMMLIYHFLPIKSKRRHR